MISPKYYSDYRTEELRVGKKIKEVAVYDGPLFYVSGLSRNGAKPIWAVILAVLLWVLFFTGLLAKSNLSHFVAAILPYVLSAIGIYKVSAFAYVAAATYSSENVKRRQKDCLVSDSKVGFVLMFVFLMIGLVASIVYCIKNSFSFLLGDYLFLTALVFMLAISVFFFIRLRSISFEEVKTDKNSDITQ